MPRHFFRDMGIMNQDRTPVRGPNDALTIPDFCETNRISVTTYFAIKKAGKGPTEMKVGKRRLISPDAMETWRRAREAEQ